MIFAELALFLILHPYPARSDEIHDDESYLVLPINVGPFGTGKAGISAWESGHWGGSQCP
jgi:hypothetical protein